MDAPAPLLIWNPDHRIAGHPLIERFVELCEPMSDRNGTILRDRFSLDRFEAMAEWLMVLTEVAAPIFRYEHYGAGIANTYGNDMTGRTTDSFPGYISRFFSALYGAVQLRGERLLSVHQPPDQIFVSTWRRLIIPSRASQSDPINGFVVLNLPENELRAGLEIIPLHTLILDRELVVRYANKSARAAFDAGRYGPWNRGIFDYAGLDLEIAVAPDDILKSGITHTTTCRHVAHQRISVFDATITATRHHNSIFYVVMLIKCAG